MVPAAVFFPLFPFIPRRSCSSLLFVPLNTNFLDWKKVHIWIISKKYWDASEYGGIQKRYKGCIYFFGGFVHGKTQKEQEGEGLEGHFLAPFPFFLVCVLSLFQEQHASCKRSQETSLGEEGTRWRRKREEGNKKKLFQSAFFLLLSSCGGWQWPEKERDPLNPKWTLSRHPTPTYSLFPFRHWLREKGAKNGDDEDVGRGGEVKYLMDFLWMERFPFLPSPLSLAGFRRKGTRTFHVRPYIQPSPPPRLFLPNDKYYSRNRGLSRSRAKIQSPFGRLSYSVRPLPILGIFVLIRKANSNRRARHVRK